MAGNLAVIIEQSKKKNSVRLQREQWEICFARFIPYPTLPSSSSSFDLLPLPPRLRNHAPRGNWISSSSFAFLRLSLSRLLLTVSFNAALLEEHFATKLHFTWPQVSCVSGYPARGIRTVLVSYRDSLGERYMEDSSFQDMLVKVEKVISELGVICPSSFPGH